MSEPQPVIGDLQSLKKLRGRPKKPKSNTPKAKTCRDECAFCVKCRSTTEVLNPVVSLTANKRHMLKGVCQCGQKLNKFVKKPSQ